jgi:DNA-binding NtrC family response regulator
MGRIFRITIRRKDQSVKRLLIVDDEPNVRLNYRITLEVEGYNVVETGTALDALQKLRTQPFDLAILDMRMPGTNGLELLASIRNEGIATPAVIITAFSDVPHAVQAMKLGAIDFLAKPLRPEELRQIVRAIILRHESNTHVEERDDFESHITAAKKLINLRDFPAASNHIERALELDSRSAEAFNLAGVLAEIMEDYDRAKRLYGQAIKINKRYEPAQQNMRRIFELFNFGSSEEPFNLGNK